MQCILNMTMWSGVFPLSLSLEAFLRIPGKAMWYWPCLHYNIEGFTADMIEMY